MRICLQAMGLLPGARTATPNNPPMRRFRLPVAGIAWLAVPIPALFAAPALAAADGQPVPPPPPPVPDAFTLLEADPVPLSRNGGAQVRLACSGGRECNGTLSLETPRPLRIGGRRKSELGSARFSIPAQDAITVGVRLSQSEARYVRRSGDLRVVTVVEEVDLAGRLRTSTIKTRLIARRG
jgi:hypothetical protein